MAAPLKKLGNLAAESTVFFLCDMQEKFKPVIQFFSEVVEVAKRLVRCLMKGNGSTRTLANSVACACQLVDHLYACQQSTNYVTYVCRPSEVANSCFRQLVMLANLYSQCSSGGNFCENEDDELN